ncbi:MAG: O-acetyl-ADP-ribose deacetylase [Candidatus Brocadiaceae bacterium]|uniref:O-acetyl-ADP-ribose deacetylase n=1 Tax=Candidatus Wunengus sp. YC61 TaxID=3367698 RepID=UPI00271FE4E6|nr:O-acetyl-ADP-ribose deacetylase [Candidatus Brocadiaceae bacterium]
MVKVTINKSILELIEGDITEQETDAIVNAANSSLLGGGGVDGAIHRAGGPKILAECRKLGGCPTGEARITTGGNLKANYVIHTVGPIYSGGKQREAGLLANAYKNSLSLASQYKLKSVAFPSISTGVYGYPVNEAAKVAIKTVINYFNIHTDIELVRFVLFGLKAYQAYDKALQELVK